MSVYAYYLPPRDMPRRSVLLKKVKFFLVLLFDFKILLALWTLLEISSPQTDILPKNLIIFLLVLPNLYAGISEVGAWVPVI